MQAHSLVYTYIHVTFVSYYNAMGQIVQLRFKHLVAAMMSTTHSVKRKKGERRKNDGEDNSRRLPKMTPSILVELTYLLGFFFVPTQAVS